MQNQILIAGQWRDGSDGQRISVLDPAGPGVNVAATRYVDVLKSQVSERLGIDLDINLTDAEPSADGSASLRLKSNVASWPALPASSAAALAPRA